MRKSGFLHSSAMGSATFIAAALVGASPAMAQTTLESAVEEQQANPEQAAEQLPQIAEVDEGDDIVVTGSRLGGVTPFTAPIRSP